MSILFWILMGVAASIVVYEIYLNVINKDSVKNAVKEKLKEEGEKKFEKALKVMIKERVENSITLDVLDSLGSGVCQIKIIGKKVTTEIKKGDLIYI